MCIRDRLEIQNNNDHKNKRLPNMVGWDYDNGYINTDGDWVYKRMQYVDNKLSISAPTDIYNYWGVYENFGLFYKEPVFDSRDGKKYEENLYMGISMDIKHYSNNIKFLIFGLTTDKPIFDGSYNYNNIPFDFTNNSPVDGAFRRQDIGYYIEIENVDDFGLYEPITGTPESITKPVVSTISKTLADVNMINVKIE